MIYLGILFCFWHLFFLLFSEISGSVVGWKIISHYCFKYCFWFSFFSWHFHSTYTTPFVFVPWFPIPFFGFFKIFFSDCFSLRESLLSYPQAQKFFYLAVSSLLVSPSKVFISVTLLLLLLFALFFKISSYSFLFSLRVSISLFILPICSCMLSIFFNKALSILIIVLKIPVLIVPMFLPCLTLVLMLALSFWTVFFVF